MTSIKEKSNAIKALMEKNQSTKPVITEALKPAAKKIGYSHDRRSPKGDKLKIGEIPPFMNSDHVKKLETQLKSAPGKIEIEVSFGLFVNNTKGNGLYYKPGVTINQFNAVLSYLLDLDKIGTWGNSKNRFEPSVSIEDREKEGRKASNGKFVNLRRIYKNDMYTYMVKDRYQNDGIDSEIWGYRISKSSEKIYAPSEENENMLNIEGSTLDISNYKPSFIRKKTRRSFVVVDDKSPFYGLSFDLTKVEETDTFFDKQSRTLKPRTSIKHEIEIERIAFVTVGTFQNSIKEILKAMQKAYDPVQLLTLQERLNAITFHNNLFKNDSRNSRSLAEFCLTKGYENKPENIKTYDLINRENNYFVTVKIDGVRGFMLITNYGIYICSPPRDIWKIGKGNPELNGTLLDVEIYTDKETKQISYHVFDILFLKGRDIRQDYFSDKGSRLGRLSLLKKAVSEIVLSTGETVKAKNFYSGPDFYENVNLAVQEATKLGEKGIKLDGLIFQSHVKYNNKLTKKWKPVEELNIDFKLARKESSGSKTSNEYILTYIQSYGAKQEHSETDDCSEQSSSPVFVPFMGSKKHPLEKAATLTIKGGILDIESSSGLKLKPMAEGLIVECCWEDDKFVPTRYRDDKENPNFYKTVESVWDDIMEPMSFETITGNSLIAMRKFHNLVKTHFLEKEFKSGDVIMDWGSGRGGDLDKWKKIGLSKVYVVEPNETNFAEFKRRYESMEVDWNGKGPEIIPMQSKKKMVGSENTKVLMEKTKGTDLDGIVSFFSLTFFGSDKAMFDNMINTIDELLPVGGKFLGIVMDGKRTEELLSTEEEIYDCPAFTISKVSEFHPENPKKGTNEITIKIKEETSMVDQTEWLFYFRNFKIELQKIGFQLKYKGFLDEKGSPELSLKGRPAGSIFNTLPENGKVFSSLNRYFMFERISKNGKTKDGKSHGRKKTVEHSLDVITDPNFDISKTLWSGKVPENEVRDFFLVRPVEKGTKYSIVHAVLYALDSKYRKLSYDQREKRVFSVIQMVASNLSLDLFEKFYDGDEERHVKFQLSLMNGEETDDEIYADMISHTLKINILRLERKKDKLTFEKERGTFGCFDNTIVLFRDGSNYEVLGDAKENNKSYLAYQTKTAFIRKIIENIANNKSLKIRE